MKKLGVIFLATVFVFGLAAQAGAEFRNDLDVSYFKNREHVFIDFDDLPDEPPLDPITTEFMDRGVEFLEGWYLEYFFSQFYWGMPYAVGNINLNNLSTTQTPIAMRFPDPVTYVGFDVQSYQATEVVVKAFMDGREVGSIFLDNGSMTFIGMEDPDGIDHIEISADGWYATYFSNLVLIDNLRFGGTPDTGSADIIVKVEIKPPNCLGAKIPIDGKSINEKSRGITPVVIVGDETYDVTEINPTTIRLQGVAPVRDAIEDASHCNAEGGDGVLDLTLKFSTQELVDAMGVSPTDLEAVENGEWPSKPLQITGNLFEESGGTAIMGEVSVTLAGKLKPEKGNRGKGSTHRSDRYQRHDRGHHHGWHKSHGQHKHKGWDKD